MATKLLKTSKVLQLYRLFDSYLSTNKSWVENTKFQYFIVRNRRLLKGPVDDYESVKGSYPEYIEYEKAIVSLIKKFEGSSDKEGFDKEVSEVEKEFSNTDAYRTVRDILDTEDEVEVYLLSSEFLPETGLSIRELDLLVELVEG
jgi:hypothetical protein